MTDWPHEDYEYTRRHPLPAVADLIRWLTDGNAYERQTVAIFLCNLARQAIPELRKALTDEVPEVRSAATAALAELAAPSHILRGELSSPFLTS